MLEHNKSVIESHIWKDDRQYNGRMTDNTMAVFHKKLFRTRLNSSSNAGICRSDAALFFWFGLSTS
jgi:hypothetical protein